MAVCNLFSELSKDTGNFLMFSQYSEDLTKSSVEMEAYRVIPSKFVVMNIDYNKVKEKIDEYGINTYNNLNYDIPKYLQNYFENSCAYLKTTYDIEEDGVNDWYPKTSANLFWKSLTNINMLTFDDLDENGNGVLNEIRYVGNINIQSHDTKNGMGYGEIYCYIPTDAYAYKYSINVLENPIEIKNEKETIEGYDDINIKNYPDDLKLYYPGENYILSFDNNEITTFEKDTNYPSSYEFNTIVVLYDIHILNENNEWIVNENNKNIPMGLYFTGKFNNTTLSNPVVKYITNEDIFGLGTSYGLRICTRFSSTPISQSLMPVEAETYFENYSAFCQVMSEMSETHSKMNNIINELIIQSQDIKDALAIFKNNKTNVPYTKEINGDLYWFVNGKNMGLATVPGKGDCDCDPATFDEVQNRIDQLDQTL